MVNYATAGCSGDIILESALPGGCRALAGSSLFQTQTCVNSSAVSINVFLSAGCVGTPNGTDIIALPTGCAPPSGIPLFSTTSCVRGDYSLPKRPGLVSTSFGTSSTCSVAEGINWIPNTAGQCRSYPTGFALASSCGSALDAKFYVGAPTTVNCSGTPVDSFLGNTGTCGTDQGGSYTRFSCTSSAVSTLLSASAAFAVLLATSMLSM